MRFKLDQNLGSRCARMLSESGHDVETVMQERLGGKSDEVNLEACVRELRCLLSLDLDFANVLRFPPDQAAGIVVLRLPKGSPLSSLEKFVRSVLMLLETEPIVGRLWIVEANRIRIHQTRASGTEESETS